ncbi:hypothetical protein BG004_006641, partial [Podila humilis]
MKFSTQLLAVVAIMVTSTVVSAQSDTTSTTTTTRPTTSTGTTTTTTTTVSRPPPTSSTQPTVTNTPPPVNTATSTTRTFSFSPTLVPTGGALPVDCMSSAKCGVNEICRLLTNTAITGTCQPLTAEQRVCPAATAQDCTSHTDCNDPQYSFCLTQQGQPNMCVGFGRPGTATECKNGTSAGNGDGKGSGGDSSVTKTLTYAGIAVGAIAVLGILFALVRWQRRRQRAKMPKSMFGDMDYGVSNRRSAGAGGASAAAGAGASSASQYPFSSRHNAQEDNNYNYDDNYYESPSNGGGYSTNMHPMTGMGGGAKMQDQYYQQDQYYDDQYYSKEGYNGYDQNGGAQDGGFYDMQNMQGAGVAAGYDNYNQQQQGQYDQYGNEQYDQYGQYPADQNAAAAVAVSSGGNGGQTGYSLSDTPVTAPPEAVIRATSPRHHQATGDYAVDHYAVEPSELDFGGDTNKAAGANPHGGYGR